MKAEADQNASVRPPIDSDPEVELVADSSSHAPPRAKKSKR